jgi:membrane protein implicated in regulation of membrane protease activity
LLTLAFVLELVAFAAFAAFGFMFNLDTPIRIVIFILLFVLLVSFWGLYMAPRATKKLNVPAYYLAKSVIYSISAIVLFNLYGIATGSVFVIACLADEILLFKHNTEK